jgi:hypothetical protein
LGFVAFFVALIGDEMHETVHAATPLSSLANSGFMLVIFELAQLSGAQ